MVRLIVPVETVLVLCLLIPACARRVSPGRRDNSAMTAAAARAVLAVRRAPEASLRTENQEASTASGLHARVETFSQIIADMTESDTRTINASHFGALLDQLDNAAAVQKCCEAVFMKLVRDDPGLICAMTNLLTRPLEPWQRNTVNQMICLVELRRGNSTAVVARVNAVLGANPALDTPKLLELLRLKVNAFRAAGDQEGYMLALQEMVHAARALGKPYAAQLQAELLRARGEPWEHLDPTAAAHLKQARTQQEGTEAAQCDVLAALPEARRQALLPEVQAQMQRSLTDASLSPEERLTMSSSFTRVIRALQSGH